MRELNQQDDRMYSVQPPGAFLPNTGLSPTVVPGGFRSEPPVAFGLGERAGGQRAVHQAYEDADVSVAALSEWLLEDEDLLAGDTESLLPPHPPDNLAEVVISEDVPGQTPGGVTGGVPPAGLLFAVGMGWPWRPPREVAWRNREEYLEAKIKQLTLEIEWQVKLFLDLLPGDPEKDPDPVHDAKIDAVVAGVIALRARREYYKRKLKEHREKLKRTRKAQRRSGKGRYGARRRM